MKDPNAKSGVRLLRIGQIISPDGPIPVGKSTWWQGVRDGRFPKPIKLGPRITLWRSEDIEELLKNGTE
ncbi:helix-turn-helix transcriptional regulator [Ruegeria arenilitoris]|uniref:helix-turn-helix transcriptional regulator n=1 Tax=Ruegeria arenilitoris TaxID=1173585 RepID=UPI00147B200D|nr:AlpA family phage regulatory protein [Ruegeria arenilitoris]